MINDNGYTYGSITESSFEEIEDDEECNYGIIPRHVREKPVATSKTYLDN